VKGLGRRPAPDDRDRKHLMIAPTSTRQFRYWWANGAWFDQGATSSCVGHAFAHYLEDGPVTQPNYRADPFAIYNAARRLDEWEGEDYDGTSVRGGAKALKAWGLIESYQWTFDLATTIYALLEVGPLVVGTNWYSSMYETDDLGNVTVSGSVDGGHAYLLNGVNLSTERVRFKNSWGRNNFGMYGHGYLSFTDLARLIAEGGEVCRAVEVRQPG
jgi:hypothetical protein